MTQLCELTQIGRIGNVKEVGQNLMISVASDASYRRDGEWVNRANWIEHTVLGRRDKMKDWALDTLQAGDLVFIRSTPSQTSWEKDGEKRYGYTMAVTELKLHDGEGGPEAAGLPLIRKRRGFEPLRLPAKRAARQRRRASARAPGLRGSQPRPGPRRAPFPRLATRSSDAAQRHERRLARRSPPRARDRPSPVPRPP